MAMEMEKAHALRPITTTKPNRRRETRTQEQQNSIKTKRERKKKRNRDESSGCESIHGKDVMCKICELADVASLYRSSRLITLCFAHSGHNKTQE